jgi:hypothetical protein
VPSTGHLTGTLRHAGHAEGAGIFIPRSSRAHAFTSSLDTTTAVRLQRLPAPPRQQVRPEPGPRIMKALTLLAQHELLGDVRYRAAHQPEPDAARPVDVTVSSVAVSLPWRTGV